MNFVEIAREGSIYLGRYMQGDVVLTYEARFPGTEGRTAFVRHATLEVAAAAYWQAIARDLELAA